MRDVGKVLHVQLPAAIQLLPVSSIGIGRGCAGLVFIVLYIISGAYLFACTCSSDLFV